MAKNIDIEQEQIEREFRNHLNETTRQRVDKFAAQMNEAMAKAAEAAAKNRKRKIAREVARCFLAVAGIACLYMAESYGLISPMLTVPAYAVAFTFIGWHLCKIDRLKVRK